ncbi:MAG: outer membrane protein [Bacteroidetes bacterium]|nr:outer membrane protein [Bacteroidota bacterium]
MITKGFRLFIFCCFAYSNVFGQTPVDSAATNRSPESYFKFNYDNDFFSATDRYYTQGIRVELSMPMFKYNPFSKVLLKLKTAKNYYGIAIEHDGFTPKSIRHDTVFVGERPYACTAFLSNFLISTDPVKLQRLTTQLDLGIIGPNAKGAEMQKGIHKALNNIQPLGWQYQVANDVVINYNIEYEKGFLALKHFEFIGQAGLRAGTLYDDVNMGAMMRVGWMQPYFENLGMTKHATTHKFQCYVFLKENVRAVQYNATMQGGVFEKNSVYTIRVSDMQRVVGTGEVGIVIAYKRVSIEYTKFYISPEFYGGLPHGWGHCVITVCF